jgi:DNA end-binding protein Ku
VAGLRVPVKLYSAVQDRSLHFHLLHAKDLAPVKQEMVDPERDEPVPREQIRRAVRVDRGIFVMLSDEELAELEPKPSRRIEVEQLVDRSAVDARWFDRPYYLGPDGDTDGYFALAEALEGNGQLAIARWVMRKKQYAGALFASGGYLQLETLRHKEAIAHIESIRPQPSRVPDSREIALAEQLIAAFEDRFDPTAYRDEYREQVLQLVERKAKNIPKRMPKKTVPKHDVSLVDILEASLHAGRKVA